MGLRCVQVEISPVQTTLKPSISVSRFGLRSSNDPLFSGRGKVWLAELVTPSTCPVERWSPGTDARPQLPSVL